MRAFAAFGSAASIGGTPAWADWRVVTGGHKYQGTDGEMRWGEVAISMSDQGESSEPEGASFANTGGWLIAPDGLPMLPFADFPLG